MQGTWDDVDGVVAFQETPIILTAQAVGPQFPALLVCVRACNVCRDTSRALQSCRSVQVLTCLKEGL